MNTLYLIAVYIHIVTVAVWFGAMLFEDPTSVRLASRMAYKVRGIGGPSLAILISTGAFMLHRRGVTLESMMNGAFFADRYGQVFALKFLCVLLLIGFQVTIGNKPSQISNFGYLLVTLAVIALSVWLVRPIV